jgi:hypothetical protein
MAKKLQNEKNYAINELTIRLDVIIRLLIESNAENKKFNKTNIVPILNNIGLDPTAIARIYGRKKASDISSSLTKKK